MGGVAVIASVIGDEDNTGTAGIVVIGFGVVTGRGVVTRGDVVTRGVGGLGEGEESCNTAATGRAESSSSGPESYPRLAVPCGNPSRYSRGGVPTERGLEF